MTQIYDTRLSLGQRHSFCYIRTQIMFIVWKSGTEITKYSVVIFLLGKLRILQKYNLNEELVIT